ncbi:hypothetical protein AB0C29_06935 [Actinoplanes sp. NPDC048791]|uniref:hypothetical protein n=1 Tax=Actinoplanes sp. NPDC048791 TaxID=3154623 RepID=UPI0033F0C60E
MDPEVLVSAMAMVVSVLALGITSTLTRAQVRSMRKANDLPVMIELLIKEYVSDEFQARHRLVTETLPTVDASLGFEGLAEPLRTAAYRVAWYYNATGGLIALNTVDELMFVGGINFRVRHAWSAMEAHIYAERARRGAPFLDGFEHLAARCFANDPQILQQKRKFEKVPAAAPEAGFKLD